MLGAGGGFGVEGERRKDCLGVRAKLGRRPRYLLLLASTHEI